MKPSGPFPLVCFVSFLALSAAANAQLRAPGRPASDAYALSSNVPEIVLPAPDVAPLVQEDARKHDWPFRYGVPMQVAIDSGSLGAWEIVDDGSVDVWRVKLTSSGAHSLGLTFSKFQIDPGAQVFLYDADKRHVLGAYTSAIENPNGMLAIEPFPGDSVVVEYVVPAGPGRSAPAIEIGEVVYDYRNVLEWLSNPVSPEDVPLKGGSCTIGINCPEGANFQDVKRATIQTVAGGGACSASILNNTAQDQIPYMLTANHCGNMTNAVFYFGYEQSGCNTGAAPQNKTLSGSQQLAANSTHDSQLYRLNQNIPASFNPFYAGWDRATSTGAHGATIASIGHSGGGPKVIAIDDNGVGSSSGMWLVGWSSGIVLGGHSGGPLFNASKRVIGPACCVSNFDCVTQSAFYGKLGSFWTANSLAQWLDPTGSNPTFLNGMDPTVNCGNSVKYGAGCPGGFGITPAVDITGCFKPNGAVTLSITLGLGGSNAFLFLGAQQAALPMGGGCLLNVTPLLTTLGPFPLSVGFPGQGQFSLPTVLPPNTAPGTFTAQAFIIDAASPTGFSNTNGVQVTIVP